jgi:hypothetical protein
MEESRTMAMAHHAREKKKRPWYITPIAKRKMAMVHQAHFKQNGHGKSRPCEKKNGEKKNASGCGTSCRLRKGVTVCDQDVSTNENYTVSSITCSGPGSNFQGTDHDVS